MFPKEDLKLYFCIILSMSKYSKTRKYGSNWPYTKYSPSMFTWQNLTKQPKKKLLIENFKSMLELNNADKNPQ